MQVVNNIQEHTKNLSTGRQVKHNFINWSWYGYSNDSGNELLHIFWAVALHQNKQQMFSQRATHESRAVGPGIFGVVYLGFRFRLGLVFWGVHLGLGLGLGFGLGPVPNLILTHYPRPLVYPDEVQLIKFCVHHFSWVYLKEWVTDSRHIMLRWVARHDQILQCLHQGWNMLQPTKRFDIETQLHASREQSEYSNKTVVFQYNFK